MLLLFGEIELKIIKFLLKKMINFILIDLNIKILKLEKLMNYNIIGSFY